MTKQTLKYEPDYAVAPGATLKEILDEKGISQAALAVRAEMAEKTISQIINGVAPITYETAEKLELVLGVPARYWNQRELAYRESQARIAATERMKADIKWLEEIPVAVLKERQFIAAESDKPTLVRLALQFFGVSSVESWREAWGNPAAQYRGGRAVEKYPGYVAAWLRMGDLQAESMNTAPFNADEFRRALADIRGMTTLEAGQWYKEMPVRCAAAGVAVVFTREIPSAAVSGAARWVTKDKALIQLSLKFKTTDQVWFTFYHEAGHILLHGKKQMFVEFGISEETADEREANEFARNQLIPPAQHKRLPSLKNRSQIRSFAESIGIDPGIVVGRLQRDELVFPAAFRDLKRPIDWDK
ncbi:MAG: helix-turn-helix domain-containing protein [Planctomycetaceae bacterium]